MPTLEDGQFPDVIIEGGPGDCIERAIIIKGISREPVAVSIEDAILLQEFGEKDTHWQLQMRSIQKHAGRTYDVLDIVLNDRRRATYYFDFTDFNCKSDPFAPCEPPSFFSKLWDWFQGRRT